MKKVNLLAFGLIVLATTILASCSFFKSSSEDYIKVLAVKFKNEDSKISLIDNEGNVLIEDEFSSKSEITPIGNLIKEETSDGHVKYWKLENKKVKQIGEEKYDDGTPFFENYAVVRDETGMLSLINDDGKEVITNLSKLADQTVVRVGVVSDGLLRFKNDEGLWGYVNVKGEIKIKPTYTSCENFVNGRARVLDADGNFNIIDKDGKKIFTGKDGFSYRPIMGDYIPFKEENGDYWGIMNFKGEKIIKDTKFKSIIPTASNKLAVSTSDKEWGVVDLKGEYLGDLRTKFENNPLFANSGEIVINEDKKVKIYDKNGVLIKEMDDYKLLVPIGKNNFLAQQKNKKFIIINREGKELSKDAFELAYYRIFADGTTPEAIEINKNNYSIQSTYFEFEPIYTKIFVKLTDSGTFGVNVNNSISDVLKAFPYNGVETGKGGRRYVSKSDDYEYEMRHGSKISGSETSTNSNSAISSDNSAQAAADTTAAPAYATPYATPASTVKDDYPFLYTWDQSYRPQSRNLGGVSLSLSFQFDQILKQEKLGQDPVFTTQTIVVGYMLNNAAKLQSITANFSFDDIDANVFWKEFEKKAIDAGFISTGEGTMVHKSAPSRKIIFGGSTFTFYFY